MNDIVERLTAETVLETYKDGSQLTYLAHPLGREAADEINRLRAENEGLKRVIEDNAKLVLHIRMEGEKLREALKPFVKENYFTTEIYKDRDEQKSLWRMVVTKKELDAAAAALKETE